MGTHDALQRRCSQTSNLRHRALRAMMSTLAGAGLTAAGVGGPLSGVSFGASVPASPPAPAEGSTAPVAASNSGAGSQEEGAGQLSTGTSTAPPSSGASTAPPSPNSSTTPKTSLPAPSGAADAPTVTSQRSQKITADRSAKRNLTAAEKESSAKASGANEVAPSPPLVAEQAGALSAELSFSAASAQALAFYRIPLFMLPIYQAAAIRYGVPWQILAAINEIETDYGSDQSVSTAGAVGWMQFMPGTWLRYGVDALDAGYADPYNPVDAVFAAARYLHAAGAGKNLRAAILAYNHSDEYADSVLLRAKLISAYPKAVIATLTGLAEGRLPVTGKQVAWDSPATTASPSPSTTTANARAVAPAAAAAAGTGARAPQLVDLLSAPHAAVVAVQDGRIVGLGRSRKLGRYVILRDIHGDVFTYAGLGKVALSYTLPARASRTAGTSVKTPVGAGRPLPLRLGSVVTRGTVLGRVHEPLGARDGHLRFAIRPAEDPSTIDPRPILANWKQLNAALQPRGAKGQADPLGISASDVFLLSKRRLEREVLSDPGIRIHASGRRYIASGAIGDGVLAALAFLSRSGLKPTVSALPCNHHRQHTTGYVSKHCTGNAVYISAVNGIPVADHRGSRTISDLTVQTLLTLQGEFVPRQIISVMQYPGAANTLGLPEHWTRIRVDWRPAGAAVPLSSKVAAIAAHFARSGRTAPSPLVVRGLVVRGDLSTTKWNRLIARIAALPTPTVAAEPSSSAIRDPQDATGDGGPGLSLLSSGEFSYPAGGGAPGPDYPSRK